MRLQLDVENVCQEAQVLYPPQILSGIDTKLNERRNRWLVLTVSGLNGDKEQDFGWTNTSSNEPAMQCEMVLQPGESWRMQFLRKRFRVRCRSKALGWEVCFFADDPRGKQFTVLARFPWAVELWPYSPCRRYILAKREEVVSKRLGTVTRTYYLVDLDSGKYRLFLKDETERTTLNGMDNVHWVAGPK